MTGQSDGRCGGSIPCHLTRTPMQYFCTFLCFVLEAEDRNVTPRQWFERLYRVLLSSKKTASRLLRLQGPTGRKAGGLISVECTSSYYYWNKRIIPHTHLISLMMMGVFFVGTCISQWAVPPRASQSIRRSWRPFFWFLVVFFFGEHLPPWTFLACRR